MMLRLTSVFPYALVTETDALARPRGVRAILIDALLYLLARFGLLAAELKRPRAGKFERCDSLAVSELVYPMGCGLRRYDPAWALDGNPARCRPGV
jgi:hypothetical protein